MVRQKELVEAVLYELQQAERLPSQTNFVGYEPDINSESIKLPLVEVSLGTKVDVNDVNDQFVGYHTNDDGENIGKIYTSLYDQTMTVAVWTAQGSKYSPRELGNTVQDIIIQFETGAIEKTLRHPELGKVDEVWRFDLDDAEHTDDLGTSPTLRRWQQTVTVSASEQYITEPDEPPVGGYGLETEEQ